MMSSKTADEKDDQAELGLHQAEVEQGLGDDPERGDGEGDAEEGGVQGAAYRGVGEVSVKDQAEAVAEGEGGGSGRRRRRGGRRGRSADHGEVDSQAGDDQEEHDGHRGVTGEHGLGRAVGEEPGEGRRREVAEHRLADEDAGDDLAHHRGETEPAADLPRSVRAAPRSTARKMYQEEQDVRGALPRA